ncbi:MAG: hypothetical protein NUW37_01430 [Planctomycetes bacterium]|nr:hypothetical protein [Planctomycetota bacterium]
MAEKKTSGETAFENPLAGACEEVVEFLAERNLTDSAEWLCERIPTYFGDAEFELDVVNDAEENVKSLVVLVFTNCEVTGVGSVIHVFCHPRRISSPS